MFTTATATTSAAIWKLTGEMKRFGFGVCLLVIIYLCIVVENIRLRITQPYVFSEQESINLKLSENHKENGLASAQLFNWLSYPNIKIHFTKPILDSVYPGFDFVQMSNFLKNQSNQTITNQVVVSDYLSETLNFDAGISVHISTCLEILKTFDVDVLIVGSSVAAQALPPALVQKAIAKELKVLQCSRPFWNLGNIQFFLQQILNLDKKIPFVIVGIDASTFTKRSLNESLTSTKRLNRQMLINDTFPISSLDFYKNAFRSQVGFSIFLQEPKNKYTSPSFFIEDDLKGQDILDIDLTQSLFFDNGYGRDYQNCDKNYRLQFVQQTQRLSGLLNQVSNVAHYISLPQLRNAFPTSYSQCTENLIASTLKSIITSNPKQKWTQPTIEGTEFFKHDYYYKNNKYIYVDGIHLNYSGAKHLIEKIKSDLQINYKLAVESL